MQGIPCSCIHAAMMGKEGARNDGHKSATVTAVHPSGLWSYHAFALLRSLVLPLDDITLVFVYTCARKACTHVPCIPMRVTTATFRGTDCRRRAPLPSFPFFSPATVVLCHPSHLSSLVNPAANGDLRSWVIEDEECPCFTAWSDPNLFSMPKYVASTAQLSNQSDFLVFSLSLSYVSLLSVSQVPPCAVVVGLQLEPPAVQGTRTSRRAVGMMAFSLVREKENKPNGQGTGAVISAK